MPIAIAPSRSPSRGRAPTIVRSTAVGRQPAASSRPDDGVEELAAVDAGRRRRPSREQAPQVAKPGRAEQRVGDGMERDVAVGMAVEPRDAGELDTAEPQRAAGPERMAVVADARTRSGPAGPESPSEPCGPREIRGDGHLEVVRLAVDDMDGDSTGLQQGGLVGPVVAGSAATGRRRRGGRRGGSPAASGPRPASVRSTVASTRRRDPLHGLGDGQDRDRGAVRAPPRR